MSDDDPLGLFVGALALAVLFLCGLASLGRAQPVVAAETAQPAPAEQPAPAAAAAPCLMPSCAQLVEGQPAPGDGYWYSVGAQAEIVELGAVAVALLDELLSGQAREAAAEVDLAAADGAVSRCADELPGRELGAGAPVKGTGRPEERAPWVAAAWSTVGAALAVGGAVAMQRAVDGDDEIWMASGAALGAVAAGVMAWSW